MYIFSCSVTSLKWLWLEQFCVPRPHQTFAEKTGLEVVFALWKSNILSKFSSDLLPVSCWEKHQALYLIMFNFPAVNFLLCLPAVCSVLQYFYQIYWTFQLFQPNLTPFHLELCHKACFQHLGWAGVPSTCDRPSMLFLTITQLWTQVPGFFHLLYESSEGE